MNDRLSAPCEVAIEITGRCNLNCNYCFNGYSQQHIPLSKIKEIFDQADEMDVFEVCISGGEPFIHEDILSILDHALSKDFNLSLVTNGTLLNKSVIQQLYDRNLINAVQISIDSHVESIHNSVRGGFTQTMRALKHITQLGADLPTIGVVLHKQNHQSICDSLQMLQQYCSGFHLMNVMGTHRALCHKDMLFLDSTTLTTTWKKINNFCKKQSITIDIHDYDLKKKETARFTGCTAGKTKVAITPELNVIPCDMVRSLIIGNLNEMTLEQIWNSDKANEIRNLEIEPCYSLNKKWYA